MPSYKKSGKKKLKEHSGRNIGCLHSSKHNTSKHYSQLLFIVNGDVLAGTDQIVKPIAQLKLLIKKKD